MPPGGKKTATPTPGRGIPKASTSTVPFNIRDTYVNGLLTNDNFDDRHYPQLPFTGPIARGFITELRPPGPYKLRFMFNPNQINYAYQINAYLRAWDQTAGVATAGVMGGHSISFDMYFNRQYEAAYKGDKQGVLQDKEILEGLVGIKVKENQGWMIQKALRFVFGNSLSFTGFIESLSVQLAYFSKDMVPMMMTVSVGATFVPDVEQILENTEDVLGGKIAPTMLSPEAQSAAPSGAIIGLRYGGLLPTPILKP